MADVLTFLGELPEPLLYAVLALGAALENVLPMVPADTFIVAGGFLSGTGIGNPFAMFLATWVLNALGAMGVYVAGRRYGERLFVDGPGRHLLSAGQLTRIEGFYCRWGVLAIFFARFLPGFRAVVPVFAGVSRQGFWRVAPPLIAASGIWYGALVWAGWAASVNIEEIAATLRRMNLGLVGISVGLALVLFWTWWKSRPTNEPLETNETLETSETLDTNELLETSQPFTETNSPEDNAR